MIRTITTRGFLTTLLLISTWADPSFGQSPSARIPTEVHDQDRQVLVGSKYPLARSDMDQGRVPSSQRLQGMSIVLGRSTEQEAALQTLLAAQQNPASSQYHQWLTPEQFAAQFGAADEDLNKVKAWLERQGFTVEDVSRSRNRITFSGSVAQVEAAFSTQMHYYPENETRRFAPSTDVAIPAAFASVVQSVGNLSSFRPQPHIRMREVIKSNFTSSQSGSHFLTPKDVATIYDINAAYNAGYTGAGQSIAVVGQSSVDIADIQNFRSAAGLPAKDPVLVLMPGTGSSTMSTGDEAESDLDLEYTGGVAKDANIYFVYTGSNTNYGVFDSIEYAVDTNIAPIISVSYGACEASLSSTDYATLNAILAQGNAQGQTLIAASGDSGSTDCYSATSLSSSQRTALAVDFPASSQYVTGMGGTEFSSSDVSASNTTYWQSASGGDVVSSALSYIPEVVWNDSSSSTGLSSGGGGTSSLTARPSWQTSVTGISSGSYRLVPDLSLASSASNPGYLYCSSDSSSTGVTGSCSKGFRDSNSAYLTVAGGTSFAAPVFAGMLAIVAQAVNANGLGNVNSTLYTLAANSTTYSSAFHDITSGSNECTAGSTYCSSSGASQYAATTGYDQASGLGSVDLYKLLTAWPRSATSSLQPSVTTLSSASSSPTSGAGDVITITETSGTSSSTVAPSGTISVTVDGVLVATGLALSNGKTSYTFSSTTAGSHVILATYSGDSVYAASSGTVTVTVGSSTGSGGTASFSVSATNVSIKAGNSGTSSVTVTPANGYTGTVTWSVSSNSTISNACYSISNLAVTGSSAVSTQMTIYTSSSACTSASSTGGLGQRRRLLSPVSISKASPGGPLTFSLASLAFLCLMPFIGRRKRTYLASVGLTVIMVLAIGACGDGASSNSNTPAGSYTLTITGTDSGSSSITASATISLTVN